MRHTYPAVLFGLFLTIWCIAAFEPISRLWWALENILVVLFVPLFVWSYFRWRLSDTSYTLLFLFMALHVLGSHYTYAQVPFLDWQGWGFERNHYDRVVHFLYGFLLVYPLRELFLRWGLPQGKWSYYVPLTTVMAASALYEIMEWVVSLIVDPASANAFLGAQGDNLDGVKDMALASLGAAITLTATALLKKK